MRHSKILAFVVVRLESSTIGVPRGHGEEDEEGMANGCGGAGGQHSSSGSVDR